MDIEFINEVDTEFITEDMKLAVRKGTQWLNENHPGWESRIDTSNLHMDDCDTCIIGQAVMDKGYWAVLEEASGTSGFSDESMNWAIEHGFDANKSNLNGDTWYDRHFQLTPLASQRYYALETLWTDVVRERLG